MMNEHEYNILCNVKFDNVMFQRETTVFVERASREEISGAKGLHTLGLIVIHPSSEPLMRTSLTKKGFERLEDYFSSHFGKHAEIYE